MELEYYYLVATVGDTYSDRKFLIGLIYGKSYDELAKEVFNFLDNSLRKSVDAFNKVYGNNLDFDDPNLADKCANKGFGIAPILYLRQKWKSGKVLSEKDFKDIDFFGDYNGAMSFTFSRVPQTIRDLRDILASYADVYGFYDDLPSDYEMEISEEKLVLPFFNLAQKWVKEHNEK